MAGIKLVTDMDAKLLFKIAFREAQDKGFAVEKIGDRRFTARKSSMAVSILLGAFVAYCDFVVAVEDYDHETELVLERNSPWWTGVIGVHRVKSWATDLVKTIGDSIEDAGNRVIREKEF